jgi:hypothetical protein
MMARCLLVLTVGLCDSGGDAPADMGQVKWEFSAPSRWTFVRGWKGDIKLTNASVVFESANLAMVCWEVKTDRRNISSMTYLKYTIDPESGLPQLESVGRVRFSADTFSKYLELNIPKSYLPAPEPPGSLHLLLKLSP